MAPVSERTDPHAGESTVGPHGAADDHGETHGHDDHAQGAGHESEKLGPIDVTRWGAALLGVALGLVVALVFYLGPG